MSRWTLRAVLIASLGVLLIGACAPSAAKPRGNEQAKSSQPAKFDAPDDGLYCNISDKSGLDDEPLFGRGVSFSDVNTDGLDDVFIANTDRRNEKHYGTSALYLNRGDGRYKRASVGLDESDLLATWGGAFGDYDNDHDPDLFITSGGYTAQSTVALYRNDLNTSGRFTRVSAESGIEAAVGGPRQWWAAAWDDYDGDGFADLAVVSLGDPIVLLHNNGNGTFSDATASLGITEDHFDAHNPVWFDFDNDRDRDLFIPDMDFSADHSELYENRVREGEGFVNVTDDRIGNVYRDAPGVFAAAASDFNQDGFDDLYLGRWSLEDVVLVNDGTGHFKAFGSEIGLDKHVTYPITLENRSDQFENSMGLGVSELDGGPPTVFLGTGNPEFAFEDIVYCTRLDASSPAGFRFTRCSEPFVRGQGKTYGHGIATSDTDTDGDTDVVWALGGHPEKEGEVSAVDARQWTSYFESRTNAGTRTASLDLVGTKSGPDAYGARIVSISGGTKHHSWMRASQGFASQNSRTTLIDTGTSGFADVEIAWPSGATTNVRVSAGTRTKVSEDGTVDVKPRSAAKGPPRPK